MITNTKPNVLSMQICVAFMIIDDYESLPTERSKITKYNMGGKFT